MADLTRRKLGIRADMSLLFVVHDVAAAAAAVFCLVFGGSPKDPRTRTHTLVHIRPSVSNPPTHLNPPPPPPPPPRLALPWGHARSQNLSTNHFARGQKTNNSPIYTLSIRRPHERSPCRPTACSIVPSARGSSRQSVRPSARPSQSGTLPAQISGEREGREEHMYTLLCTVQAKSCPHVYIVHSCKSSPDPMHQENPTPRRARRGREGTLERTDEATYIHTLGTG
ncbi:hypothetical protein BS50DRAFT_93150 [Corynespora cassiicola Philippines]|uniref:Uncharacterized protein n=1 Tax=Corynespora cassiicola Philippines TaxID=1448308 RepID=A0A2T2NEY8_CORCC|nr:hypothetical protein BS50DRAFT_93150 [Corynespora cassiicola Philippines]